VTAQSAAPAELPRGGTYRVDPERSTVSYSGRHIFGLGAVHATFTISSGLLRVADPITASTAEVTVDASSFRSDKARRDKDVRSRMLLNAATYPEITFVSDSLRQDGVGWVLTGAVTAHGTRVPVQVRIDRVATEGDSIRVHARAEHLDRYAFGVTKGKGMAGRFLDLDLDVAAHPA
jgi:polyisoprenoid-binding protein YceI